jgi:death-on-curing protein
LNLLEPETVSAINRVTIERHGGMYLPPDNLRVGQSLGFVEQIQVNRVFGQVLYATPYHQAAAYLYYTVKNHSFHDGNKRTGLACALTILEWNGLVYRRIRTDAGEAFVVSVARSRIDPGEEIDRIASWLRPGAASLGRRPASPARRGTSRRARPSRR